MRKSMRILALICISAIFFPSAADEGKDNTKVKVCEEFHILGAENLRVVFTAVFSQKFPNGTFEEVTCMAGETVKLAEECCREESASSECWAAVISDRSCKKNTMFAKHPGMEQCCSLQGKEWRLCLATLRYSEAELPSFLTPTNEDICTQYKQHPSDYATRYVYEFARSHRTIPAGFMLNASQNYVRMAENCCNLNASNSCFFKEQLQHRSTNTFLRYLSNICNNQVNLKSYQTGLTAYFGNLLRVPFEEALAISQHLQSALEKCCLQRQPKCIIEEFTSLQKILCKESIVGNMSEEFKRCCSKSPLDTLTCVDNLKRQPEKSADAMAQVREESTRQHGEIGVKQVSVSLPVLATFQDHIRGSVEPCCSNTSDAAASLKEKEQEVETTQALLSKADNFCSQFFKLELPAFKTMLQQEVQGERGEARSQAWVELVTKCCFQHSPPQLCQKLVSALTWPVLLEKEQIYFNSQSMSMT